MRQAGATLHRGEWASHYRGLSLRRTGSRCTGSVIVAHRPSCSTACGIFPGQGSNPCPLHWQADSQPLRHQGSPPGTFWFPGAPFSVLQPECTTVHIALSSTLLMQGLCMFYIVSPSDCSILLVQPTQCFFLILFQTLAQCWPLGAVCTYRARSRSSRHGAKHLCLHTPPGEAFLPGAHDASAQT